jgi:hypothetical protein
MADKTDRIQLISCKYEDYELIHSAVVAAAKQARRQGDEARRMALGTVLVRLAESEGLTKHHLARLALWDVD